MSFRLGLGMGLKINSPGAGGGGLSLPAGALGLWLTSDYATSPRKSVPNSLGSGATDANILSLPRRAFTSGALQPWNRANCTLTDCNQTAPDGSTEASTLVATGTAYWLLQQQSISLPAGTYTLAVSVKDLGSVATQILVGRDSNSAAKTLSGSWQRFSHTFTLASPTSITVGIFRAETDAAVDIAICDLELFAGSSDLNTNALTQKPLRIQNADIITGKWDVSTVTISDSELSFGDNTFCTLQLPAATTPTGLTYMFTGKRRTATLQAWEALLAQISMTGKTYDVFTAGLDVTSGPHFRIAGGGSAGQISDGLFGGCGERFTFAITYDGANQYWYINGAQVYTIARTTSFPELRDLFVGSLFGGGTYPSSYNQGAMALWDRALTAAEIQQATDYIEQGMTMPSRRLVVLEGDSIHSQAGGRVGFELAVPGFGWNHALPNARTVGNSGNSLDGRKTMIDGILSSAPSGTMCILAPLIGANDLTSDTATWLSNYAAYCDGRRAAGWKVVVCTVLPQNGNATFNANRATVNAAMTGSWVGVHCDAIADYAADATMGGDDSYTNFPSRWADGVHPNNSGHDILMPILAAAIDSIT